MAPDWGGKSLRRLLKATELGLEPGDLRTLEDEAIGALDEALTTYYRRRTQGHHIFIKTLAADLYSGMAGQLGVGQVD